MLLQWHFLSVHSVWKALTWGSSRYFWETRRLDSCLPQKAPELPQFHTGAGDRWQCYILMATNFLCWIRLELFYKPKAKFQPCEVRFGSDALEITSSRQTTFLRVWSSLTCHVCYFTWCQGRGLAAWWLLHDKGICRIFWEKGTLIWIIWLWWHTEQITCSSNNI